MAINRIDPVYLNEVYLSGLTGSPITLNRTSLHRHMRAYKHRDGYRRLHILLGREGPRLNHKRLFRLYREERLGVPSGAAGNERSGHARRWLCRRGPNQRWSLDFVSDALASGRRFRVLAVVDDFTRECLGLIAAISLSGLRVGRELDRIAEVRGYPAMVVSDNGTELTSHAMLRWREERSVLWHYIRPGKLQRPLPG